MIVGKEECYGANSTTYNNLKMSSSDFGKRQENFERIPSQTDARKLKLGMQDTRSLTSMVNSLNAKFLELNVDLRNKYFYCHRHMHKYIIIFIKIRLGNVIRERNYPLYTEDNFCVKKSIDIGIIGLLSSRKEDILPLSYLKGTLYF